MGGGEKGHTTALQESKIQGGSEVRLGEKLAAGARQTSYPSGKELIRTKRRRPIEQTGQKAKPSVAKEEKRVR